MSRTFADDQQAAKNWEPEFCPQCGQDIKLHSTSFGPETLYHRGIRWTISCSHCGGLFDIELRSAIDND
jgi:transcription elongation factor Elf1